MSEDTNDVMQSPAPVAPDVTNFDATGTGSDETQAPAVQTPSPDSSTLNNIVQSNPQQPQLNESGDADVAAEQAAQPKSGSRLGAIISAIAGVVGPGIAGAANQRGRASFAGGMAGGAEAELNHQAQQQDIKFKTAADAARAAQLTMQEKQLQMEEEDHQMKVDDNSQKQVDWNIAHNGTTYTFVPNDEGGKSVMGHFKGQMMTQGSVQVPVGTIASSKGWYVPNQGSTEQAQGNTNTYNRLASFYALPQVNGGLVNDQGYAVLNNMRNGLNPDGKPMSSADLGNRIGNLHEQLAKFQQNPNADTATVQAVQDDIKHLTNLQANTQKREDTQTKQAITNEATAAGAKANATGERQKNLAEATAKNADNTASGSNVTGPAYLASLPKSRQATVQAIGEGRMELTPSMLRTKDGQALAQQVNQAYPDYDQTMANAYTKTRSDFTSGPTSKGINYYNTAIAHLGTMYDHVSATNSVQINNPISDVHRQLDLDKQMVSAELAKAVAGGQLTVDEQKAIMYSISGMTVSSYQTRIKEAVTLLQGKLAAYQHQWQNGMPKGVVAPVQIVTPEAQSTIARINGQQQSAPQTQNPTPQTTSAQVPPNVRPIMKNGQVVAYIQNGQRTNI